MSDTQNATLTPKQLAAELGIDPKRLRGWLRKEHTRTNELHNSSWTIDAEVADAARAKFAPKANDPA